MRVHNRGAPQVLERRLASPDVSRLQLELDARAVRAVPQDDVLRVDPRLVLLGVEEDLEEVRGVLFLDLRGDPRWPRGGQVRVEDRGGDPDTLLPSGLPMGVEPGAVEQLPEDVRDLPPKDPRPVVGDRDPVPVSFCFEISTEISGRIEASSAASNPLSTASFTVVRRARWRLSNPSICRFRSKNSATDISRCLAASCWAIVGGGGTGRCGREGRYNALVRVERRSLRAGRPGRGTARHIA